MSGSLRARWVLGVAGLAALGFAFPARGQDVSAVLTGYGTVGYRTILTEDGDNLNDFSAAISPILLFQANDVILFESELEFELEGAETETELEYAQVVYQGFDRVQLVAGKFLLPFGVFGERLHPSWINKMPSMPLIYGHAHEGVAEGALLPVLSDAGAMIRYAQPFQGSWRFDLSAWVSQGPQLAEHSPDELEPHETVEPISRLTLAHEDMESPFPDIAFGVSFDDNNTNKMIGARVGLVRGGGFEAYVSGFHATVDEDNELALNGFNLSAELRYGPFEMRGEGILLRQEFLDEDQIETVSRPGYYIQASTRAGAFGSNASDGAFEPVVRWSQIMDAKVNGEAVTEGVDQLALGLTYWITPSVPVKAAYEVNQDRDDRFLLQWAFGF